MGFPFLGVELVDLGEWAFPVVPRITDTELDRINIKNSMKSNLLVLIGGIIFFSLSGVWLTFYSSRARELYYDYYKTGIRRIGFLTSWIDKYPEPWFFRMFGFVFLVVATVLIIVFVQKFFDRPNF